MKKILLLSLALLFVALAFAQSMTLPHFENFDTMPSGTGVAPSANWSRIVYHPTGFANATVNIATTSPYSSPNSARLFTDSNPDAQIMLISPETENLGISRIRFWARIAGTITTHIPWLIVGYMTDPTDYNTFVPIETVRSLSTAYQQFEVPFVGFDYDEDSRYFIAFKHGVSAQNRAILIDDFYYEANPESPIFSVSPEDKNFGAINVATQSNPQVFTISNTGIGAFNLTSATITGADQEEFIITDQPTSYPTEVTEALSSTISVAFSPSSAGQKAAFLSIEDNLNGGMIHDIPLSGTGVVPLPGTDHNNPIPVTLPHFSFQDLFDGYEDNYNQDWVSPSQELLAGNDVVFSLELLEDSFVSATLAVSFAHGGIYIVRDVPNAENPAAVLVGAGGESQASFSGAPLTAGSYYVIVSSFLNSPPTTGQAFSFTFLAVSAGPATFSLNTNNHSFAYIPLGRNASKTFTAQNTGGGQITIQSIQISTPQTNEFVFSAPTGSIDLQVGQSLDFSLTFVPLSVGAKQAEIQIEYTIDPARPGSRMMTVISIDGFAHTEFAGGSGTLNDPYLISAPYHLNSIRYHIGESSRDKYFMQTADLDFDLYPYNTGLGWEPIGSYITDTNYQAFTGNYNGNNYLISNLYSARPTANHIGLFGVIDGATIRNITMENINLTGVSRVGSLVGYVFPNYTVYTNITRCSANSGSVTGVAFVGGLVGWNGRGIVSKCWSGLNVLLAANHVSYDPSGKLGYGGLVGNNMTMGLVEYCYSTANVNGYSGVGGLVGYQSQGNVKNSYARGNVTGLADYVGGLVGGNLLLSTIDKCFSTGYVTAQPGRPAGGLLGAQLNMSETTSSFWDMETSGMIASAGTELGKTTLEMTYPYVNTYPNWNFTETWQHDSLGEYNSRYPFLRWQITNPPPPTPNAPVVSILANDTQIVLSWPVVDGASLYNIYASDTPVPANWGAPIASTMTTSCVIPTSETHRFFVVRAISLNP